MQTKPKPESKPETENHATVEFSAEVLRQIRQHARSSMQEEICGVLIGKTEGNVIAVTGRIAGIGAVQAEANVTFTQDTWEHIYKIKDAEFPSESIVGWYHSHPGFGIFLSNYDLFIHQNFFNAPHQIAWVVDPHSDEEGCFGWMNNKVKALDRINVIHDDHPVAVDAETRTAPDSDDIGVTPKKPSAPVVRDGGEPFDWSLIIAILAFACGWMSHTIFQALPDAPPSGATVELNSAAQKPSTSSPPQPVPPKEDPTSPVQR